MLEFHFLWDRCRFAKPLRIQTKDKNNGLSDYSHTDLHYLKSFSQLGCLQRGHPSPTKIQSWRVNAGAWAGSVRQMDRWRVDGRANATPAHLTAHRPLHGQSTKLVYMWITYAACVEKGNRGPFKSALPAPPWRWRRKVVGFEGFRSAYWSCFPFMKEAKRRRRRVRFRLNSKSN